jgi:hypothetical protein
MDESDEDLRRAIEASRKDVQTILDKEKVAKLKRKSGKRQTARTLRCTEIQRMAENSHSVGEYLSYVESIGGLPEFLFFLRFFWESKFGMPERSSLFADSESGLLSESAEGTLDLMRQEPGRAVHFQAWYAQVASKLSDLTACAHLCDTLLSKAYAALKSDTFQRIELKDRPRYFLEHLNARKDHYLVHVEVGDAHAFLIDIPSSFDYGYLIESVVFQSCGRVSKLPIAQCIDRIYGWSSLDKFDVYVYDVQASLVRLREAYDACYDQTRLEVNLAGYAGRIMSWNHVLDHVYMLSRIAEDYPAVLRDPLQIFEPFLQ